MLITIGALKGLKQTNDSSESNEPTKQCGSTHSTLLKV